MKTLMEHNAERDQAWINMNDSSPRPNGIACPECGKELMDSNPFVTLTSAPPQKNVHCPACGYVGYRRA